MSLHVQRCLFVACGLVSTACFNPVAPLDAADIDTSTGAEVEASDATTAATPSSTSNATGSSSSTSTSTTTGDSDTSTSDAAPSDLGGVQACDTFDDDCPDGTKCTAFASAG